ncbi:S-adenosylmethionine:tRNA ribosyltransferase-isomerase [Alkalihalobacillus pseudalcaliphilus]|uniref:S-adenosylmethionine:tRNA ribosyltransferase-isomerase n=1 Tax=Alkalihalobacillus pseudalcaliphilus TaxID=79884 RepID=UPI00064DDD27|nr:S-adenosylmethionine:tRNA ribosyltransferase-isomerase [Alkalihalobacillus pseudalcaliphilus]KMK77759.1 S-adenosylmethionine tRNA ribosyltransferase [Alkalihalobacillus pseudalcaliphilus]
MNDTLSTNNQTFQIPSELNAEAPIEYSKGQRDRVQLLTLDRKTGTINDQTLLDLPHLLQTGDLLVFNRSRTIPAVLKTSDQQTEIRLARKITDTVWEAILFPDSSQTLLKLPENVQIKIIGKGSESPLIKIQFEQLKEPVLSYLHKYGTPIRYEYINKNWPLSDYQTMFASVPGSIEMPSAGRAFTWSLIKKLKKVGIRIAFLELHAGISYYGNDHWPNPLFHPEAYSVPEQTFTDVIETKRNGNRVIAVGTTVVRALETVALNKHSPTLSGHTNLYVTGDTSLNFVDGLLTGLHEPETSHLHMLRAFTKEEYVRRAYHHALNHRYLWHEFGDINLIL